MKKKRNVIEIDEAKCTGCGNCILACQEGALVLKDGKAKLTGEVYCDGLGACIGECPEGALTITTREADDFDEQAVAAKAQAAVAKVVIKPVEATLPCGCPSSQTMTLRPPKKSVHEGPGEIASTLGYWPIKLTLLNPQAPFLKGADLLLLADCVAAAFPELHRKLLKDRTVAMGCPKLDDLDAHIAKLTEVLATARPRSLKVAHMEVPCCRGFVFAAEEAIKRSGVKVPLSRIMIGRTGEVLEEETLALGPDYIAGCETRAGAAK